MRNSCTHRTPLPYHCTCIPSRFFGKGNTRRQRRCIDHTTPHQSIYTSSHQKHLPSVGHVVLIERFPNEELVQWDPGVLGNFEESSATLTRDNGL